MKSLQELAVAVSSLDPPCFIFGGVGEDAVLDGTLTRPHSDVDVLVHRSQLDRRLEQIAELGYGEWETWLADHAGRPQVLHGSSDGVDLEMSIFEDDRDEVYFEFTAPSGLRINYFPPPSMFDCPAVTLDGLPVQTISPLGLYNIRAGVAATGAFGELRAQDAPVQQRLRRELLVGVDEAELTPVIRPA